MSQQEKSFDECHNVVEQVWQFLDHELDEASAEAIRRHLVECEPCLDTFDMDQALKSLVHEHCGGDTAPSHLRAKIITQLTTFRQDL
jgi:mycothiol system anti-sigma-R factor